MKKKKIVVSIFVTLLLLVMVGVNGWWFYIKFYGPDKLVSNTYEVGLQTITNSDGEEESRYFVELNYFANKTGDGVELFEIKYNYTLDENQTDFYSQGLQYTAEPGQNIDFKFFKDNDAKKIEENYSFAWPVPAKRQYGTYGGYFPTSNVFNYASGDDYATTTLSTNPISTNTRFKIELGDDMFFMKFKNEDTAMTKNNLMFTEGGDFQIYFVYNEEHVYNYYCYYDYTFFSKLLYENVVKVLPSGLNHAVVFEFGDLFDYYKLENGQYVNTSAVETEKIKNDVKSYYAIKVSVFDGGAKSASDSIFNMLNGSPYYNANPAIIDDYVVGRSHKTITEKDFDVVIVDQAYCVLKLKEDFVKFYSKFDTIIYDVQVNLDGYNSQGIEILGFAQDSGLSRFRIDGCYFLETIEGTVVQTEVAYV